METNDLYEEAPCGLISVSKDGTITRANRTLSNWLGHPKDEILGAKFYDLLSIGERIAYETNIKPLLRMSGHANEISFNLLAKSGDRVPFICNLSNRTDEEGNTLSTRFALFKATDRRGYEKSLLAMRDTAEEKARLEKETSYLRDKFIAVLGHDLRNPLASILSGINLIKRRVNLGDKELLILDNMSKSAWRAENLIRDVLDFAKGRFGNELSISAVPNPNLEQDLKQVINEVKTIVPDRDIDVNISLSETVICDSDRIGQLLSNLLSNALTHGDPLRSVKVEAKTEASQFVLSAQNFGKSIPPEFLKTLFKPFSRGQESEQVEGLGLGLYIVSEIAKAHKGHIDVISDKNSTIFTLIMPLSPS